MAHRSRVVFAACAICLLLSAAPIDAKRMSMHDAKAQEEVKGLKSEWWGQSTCSRLQDRFTRVSQRGASSVQGLNTTGEVGYASASRSMFAVWSMARVVRRAQRNECDWADSVDLDPLRQIIQSTLSTNPCLPVVQSRLESSEESSVEDQTNVILSSMGMLMTASCEPQSMTDRPAQPINEPHDDNDAEDEVEELLDELMNSESADASLLQVSEGQPTGVHEATLRFWPPPSWMGVDRWIVRGPDIMNPLNPSQVLVPGAETAVQSAGPATAVEWITHGLGVGAWLIGFTLLCVGAVYLVAFVLSALLCLLRSILLVLLGQTTSMKTCLDRAVHRVSEARSASGFVSGLCLAGGAALITTSGGVLGVVGGGAIR